jgi:DNA repair exonuclease SbcCD nuclease subunit
MRVAVLTDTHWGARGDSRAFLDYFTRFHDEVFFPYLERYHIDTIYHLGDLVDRRKYISHVVANRMREAFTDRLVPYRLYIIPGNHDCPYRTSLDSNAVREMLGGRDNVTVIDEPKVSGGFLFLPWICPSNEETSKGLIEVAKNAGSRVVLAHLELSGFQTQRGKVMEKGMDPATFSSFPLTLSGHYHHKNALGNIHYLGCPYEITWADHDDQKGFHVLDTETLDLEFIKSPLRMHERLEFDDRENMDIDFSNYCDKIVKVAVCHRDNTARFDSFISRLEEANPAAIQIMDDELLRAIEDEKDDIGDVQNTLGVLLSYIDSIGDSVDKIQLKELLGNLYLEAAQIGS